ncbi:MAG: hypothetical protein SFV17_06650 [Candidatus Obscuribacter sp.]|nr:hypothetical protein [Candidatus Melainabacteria bacterium]MDX1986349.1 hypothetical protein [Candidatus Obscuribacter sp.]
MADRPEQDKGADIPYQDWLKPDLSSVSQLLCTPQEMAKILDDKPGPAGGTFSESLSACANRIVSDKTRDEQQNALAFKSLIVDTEKLEKKGQGGDINLITDAGGNVTGFDISFPIQKQ